ncbi:MAG: hypothetical protein KZY61_05200 [Clostridiaceae bacterium]|nr:hypothetical protein [Clostridiaceae bacterium]MBW4858503.1 hypothetical protein [Clostridiaceae bacterium]MBW4867751.1 hypothetical protein [Clostridiaceae bacterium]MBW4868059.1 hypothetical protein [Clostridiaceae bacterium]
MRKLFSLIKTDLNMTFGLSSLSFKAKEKQERWKFILIVVVMFSLIPFYRLFVSWLLKIYTGLSMLNQEGSFMLIGILYSQLIVFILGIVHVMSKYYFSNDLNILVPAPIKSSFIIGSKFISICISQYISQLVLTLPFIIIYGIKSQLGFLFWIYSFIIFLTLPIIPLSFSSIIVMFFMKYTNIKGKKDLIRGIGYFLLIGIIVFLQLKIQSLGNNIEIGGEQYLNKLLADNSILIKNIGKSFPPSIIGTFALVRSNSFNGFLNLILFISISIGSFILLLFISEKIFFSGLIGSSEMAFKKSSLQEKTIKDSFAKSYPQYISIFLKEIKMLFRTPIYLFNSIGGVIIIPIVLVMTTIINGKGSFGAISGEIEDQTHLITLFGIGLISLLGMTNSVGCTTFSREGKNFWISRVIPVKVEHQIIGKILSSLFIQLIAIAAFIISISFIFDLTLTNILGIVFLGLLGSIPMTELGMIVDIMRPLLVWDNPQKAMKENLNVILGMVVGILYLLVIGMIVFYYITKLELNIIYFIITTIFILSSFLLFVWLKKLCISQFSNIE